MNSNAFLLTLCMAIFLTGCTDQTIPPGQPPINDTTETITTQGDISTTSQTEQDTQTYTIQTTPSSTMTIISEDPQLAPPKKGEKIAIIETDLGTIKMKFFGKDVPELTKNFEMLVKAGKYKNVPFHRVIKDFMIQTGDFTNKNGTGGHSYKGLGHDLENEINPKYHHLYGTVSMAKTSLPVSIGSQFFIVTNKDGTPFLDGGYSPIGQVFEGMDIAEKIADLQKDLGSQDGTPSKIINMKKVTMSTYKGK